MFSSSNSAYLSQFFRSVSHSDSWSLVSDKPRIGWRSQREGPVARPKQREALLVQYPWSSHPRTTQGAAESGAGCASQSIDRPPGSGCKLLQSCESRAKPVATQTCASFKRPVSVRRRGAHKDGLCCNRGSILVIAGSRIPCDGSKDSVALLRLAKELHQELAQ